MAELKIYDANTSQLTEDGNITDRKQIQDKLKAIGLTYDVWVPEADMTSDAAPEVILDAFKSSVAKLKAAHGFKVADVISLTPSHPQKGALRAKFLDEHVHSDDEARYFVDGQGLFYVHSDDKVYGILCQKGDLINVPAGTKHWFDMGEQPHFKCIRVFTDEAGWVASYTGDPLASRFPSL